MGICFSILSPHRRVCKVITNIDEDNTASTVVSVDLSKSTEDRPSTEDCSEKSKKRLITRNDNANPKSQNFSFLELANATDKFKEEFLIGEGGFGKVYKGELESGQIVAIKLLDQNGVQGNREFMTEVLMLSILKNPYLVSLVGYCTTGDQRALVYEFMQMGSLERYLFDLEPGVRPLDWNTRIRIAVGAARGLEYLHCNNDPPVIHRDLKSANLLLDEDFNSKLADFGLAKLGPVGDKSHVSTRVMGTYGYCAPEYAESGKLTIKSDIFSFGIVILELITGRRSYDSARPQGQRELVNWAFKFNREPRRLVDPLLRGCYPEQGLKSVIAMCQMCCMTNPSFRPYISDIRMYLENLASQPYNPETHGRDKRW
ncbi:putative serine/threonine-protein kinase pbl21 [Ranunculus cassubicifolius]